MTSAWFRPRTRALTNIHNETIWFWQVRRASFSNQQLVIASAAIDGLSGKQKLADNKCVIARISIHVIHTATGKQGVIAVATAYRVVAKTAINGVIAVKAF